MRKVNVLWIVHPEISVQGTIIAEMITEDAMMTNDETIEVTATEIAVDHHQIVLVEDIQITVRLVTVMIAIETMNAQVVEIVTEVTVEAVVVEAPLGLIIVEDMMIGIVQEAVAVVPVLIAMAAAEEGAEMIIEKDMIVTEIVMEEEEEMIATDPEVSGIFGLATVA